MNKDNEKEFIRDVLNETWVELRCDVECKLIAVAGSDNLIREHGSYCTSVLILYHALCHSEDRARHISRVIGDGRYTYILASLLIHQGVVLLALQRKLLDIIKEENNLDVCEMRTRLKEGELEDSVCKVLDRLYPEEV